MALSFGDSKGSAKGKVDYFKLEDGMNQFRILPGTILAIYSYWIPRVSGTSIPMECLSFNREKEQFTNVEKDWPQQYFPDINCGWAYACQVANKAGEVKVLTLKKKMYEQIQEAAEELGDPTDLKTGWDCMVMRKKTGSQAYNVEYSLQVLKCKPSEVSEQVIKTWKEGETIDELIPRPTPEAQLSFIKSQCLKEGDDNTDEAVAEEFDEDTPAF